MKFNSLTKDELQYIENMYNNETKFKSTDIITHIDTSYSKKDLGG